MYDALRATYRFHCPEREDGAARGVALSAFRRIERLAGARHPAVFQVVYACACGGEHVGLVCHRDLDYAPLGAPAGEFVNVMTGRSEPVADELVEVWRIEMQRGNWPWRLYCSREARLVPVFPSALALVAPREGGGTVGVAMRCPACGELSLNLVSEPHLDVPFYHDRVVRYVDRPFGDERDVSLERFHEQLFSARFDAERARLD
jgi:hypothetical protein